MAFSDIRSIYHSYHYPFNFKQTQCRTCRSGERFRSLPGSLHEQFNIKKFQFWSPGFQNAEQIDLSPFCSGTP